ncbi:MAG: hypothetical protein LBH28_09215 [Oscillospiraceae bacterium]|nr:hypothetical protein [Oscillospiraceae bacterium]
MKKKNLSVVFTFAIFVTFLAIFLTGCLSDPSNIKLDSEYGSEIKKMELSASWAIAYSDIKALTNASDFIGLVEIGDIVSVDAIYSGNEDESESSNLYTTTYSARVISAILSEEKTIGIIMTGKRDNDGTVEILDDPLMSKGETCFIFARLNDNGYYTILSGPNGRFSYNEANNTITSFSNSPLCLQEVALSDVEGEIRLYLDK